MNLPVLAPAGRLTLALMLCAAVMTAVPASARKKQAPPPPPSETGLIDNVNGLAIGADGHVAHFTGLLIGKDGRVEQRLGRDDKRPDRPAYRLDGQGRTLIPSFVDGHAHLIATGITSMTLDLSATRSLAEAQAKIAAYARANEGRKWILGRGWDAARWAEAEGTAETLPTAADLDAAVADIPVWLVSADGEMGWANSLAMKQAGVTPATKTPPGGHIVLTGNRPGGVFIGAAMALVGAIIPPPAPKDRDIALDKAQPLFLAAGISTVADMGTSIYDWQAYRRAGDRGALRLRIAAYADGLDDMVTIAGPAPSPWLYDDRLRLVGVHFAIDGSIGARTAWLKAPYTDAPGEKGAPRIPSTVLRNQMSRAAMDGFQVALSAHGDAAIDEALAAIDELAATYEGDRRWRIEGADVTGSLTGIDSAIFHDSIVTVKPDSAGRAQALTLRRLGQERAAPAWSTLGLILGARLSFGDWAAGHVPSPFAAMAAAMGAATMGAGGGDTAGPDAPVQRLTFERAFAAATGNGARALFAEQRIGSLASGQWADFLLIDRDISTALPTDVAQARLLEHWVAGKRVWKAPEAPDTIAAPVR
ncbi:MAG: amidohydrolase [Sphingobium sp.]